MYLFTARFSNPNLAAMDAGKIQISRGAPRFLKLNYERTKILQLAPNAALLKRSREGLPSSAFEVEYRQQLDALGIDIIRRTFELATRYFHSDSLVLLCFEDVRQPPAGPGKTCHRRMLAKWYEEQTGEPMLEVPE